MVGSKGVVVETPHTPSPLMAQDVLVVVATPGEAGRLSDLGCRVMVSGVGAVAAALATAGALAPAGDRGSVAGLTPPRLVVSAGIAGAFAPSGLQPGDLALSSHMIQADYGAELGPGPDAGFLDLAALDLRVGDLEPDAAAGCFAAPLQAAAWAAQLGAAYGPMLTLNTVTGSAERAAALLRRFPDALTEGMEGAGVAHAAALAGVPALELRGISNLVGPRDRAGWHIPEALTTVRRGLGGLIGLAL